MTEIENIRLLCAEVVENAGSGHPGAPMGLSYLMHILYTEYLVLDPDDPQNPSRDIIVLSNGHACTIQYIMNYFVGFLTMDDLKSYRKFGSRTPGHPEKNSLGIEISTGPLGQGVAASVGFAISAKLLSNAKLSHSNDKKMNEEKIHIYCVFGDGCYQEGIAQEAFSFCSRQGLDNITFIYDFNCTTIDGPTDLSMAEDVVARFKSLNFNVVEADGDDASSMRNALNLQSDRPKAIILRTSIGKDSELEGSCKAHGSPLGKENIKKLKERYNLPYSDFYVSDNLYKIYKATRIRMKEQIKRRSYQQMPSWKDSKPAFSEPYTSTTAATRLHFSQALNKLQTKAPILSGCADLTPSVLSKIDGATDLVDEKGIRAYLRFGIREHCMCAVMNGIASHGVFVPICGTFLNFITYGYPSVRLAAMDRLKVIYVLTHDSILLGGDGPTHQPIEVLATMRATPGLVVLRPCDGRETRAALSIAMKEPGPVAVILSRQPVAEIDGTQANISEDECDLCAKRGAYFVHEESQPDVVIMATGAEVDLAQKIRAHMADLRISIVSFISFELFNRQDLAYKSSILNKDALKVSIEALTTFGWAKYADLQIGLDEFGKSGSGEEVYKHFGFTVESISTKILNRLHG